MYKIAAQNKIRFASVRGELTVEQLFDLPLKANSGFDLDTIARTINGELKGMSEESFVEDVESNPRKRTLEVSLEIVKDVIKTKQEASQAALNRHKKAVERKKILDAIGAKKDSQLSSASLEELEKQLSQLEE
jgi:hypothetical protein